MKTTTRALLLSALTTALVLTGCSSTGGSATDPTASEAAPGATSGADASAGNQHDVMFLENMIPHHQQAIDMSEIVLAKDGVDERVTDLAERIRAAQQPEIEEMTALLEDWGYDADASAGHGGHGMGTGGGMMMSEDDMEALEAADGAEASRLFLEQMIVHHEGAVMMAQSALSMGRDGTVAELAQRMVDDQTAEIAEMRQLLTEL
ncbi:DUF305 domain-containing protein [Agrococcus sp. HG114]|uniref:DUF305 domain-containing protein n=1 Tax=Agrococcus sp. HG114 TaxID=2969757 RepID=UPI00215AF177|nr:DUF305 domain-containing protein [Agrococcus sp. HG114]MCR8671496.1 DUF305 domain-containing protein [Agrococcus sp. HG114]